MRWLNEILIRIKRNEKPLHTESNHPKALAERCKTNASIGKSLFVCLCEKCKFSAYFPPIYAMTFRTEKRHDRNHAVSPKLILLSYWHTPSGCAFFVLPVEKFAEICYHKRKRWSFTEEARRCTGGRIGGMFWGSWSYHWLPLSSSFVSGGRSCGAPR